MIRSQSPLRNNSCKNKLEFAANNLGIQQQNRSCTTGNTGHRLSFAPVAPRTSNL